MDLSFGRWVMSQVLCDVHASRLHGLQGMVPRVLALFWKQACGCGNTAREPHGAVGTIIHLGHKVPKVGLME